MCISMLRSVTKFLVPHNLLGLDLHICYLRKVMGVIIMEGYGGEA